MERNVLMTMNGLSGRRRRITVQRASSDEHARYGLPEMGRFTGGEYPKRRTDTLEGSGEGSYTGEQTWCASDEEYSDDGRVLKENTSVSSLLSAPGGVADIGRVTVDGALGFFVPRKARSDTRRDYRVSEMSQQKNAKPASCSGGASKRKMTVSESRAGLPNLASDSSSSSTTQAEMEVAEALFDLMKQCQPIERDPQTEKLEKDKRNYVHHEEIVVKSIRVSKTQVTIKKRKPQTETFGELLHGHEFTNKREIDSLSCATVNAEGIQNPMATSAYPGRKHVVEVKKGAKCHIDLMAPLPMASPPERGLMVDAKNGDQNTKNGELMVPFASKVLDEKPGVSPHLVQQPTPFLPSGMTNWKLPQLHEGYPMEANARSWIMSKVPQFKLPQPRKKSVLHDHIARSIQHHQKLTRKCLTPGPTAPASPYGSQVMNLHTTLAAQSRLGDFLATKNLAAVRPALSSDVISSSPNDHTLLQQVRANVISCGPGLSCQNRQDHLSKKVPSGSSGSATCVASLPSNSSAMPSANFSFPGGVSAVSLNHPAFPPGEAAFISLLQKSGYQVPLSANIALPQFREGVSSPASHAPRHSATPKTSSIGGSLSQIEQPRSSGNDPKGSSPTVSIATSPYADPYSSQTGSLYKFLSYNAAGRTNDPATPMLNFVSMMQNPATFQFLPRANRLGKTRGYTQQQLHPQMAKVTRRNG